MYVWTSILRLNIPWIERILRPPLRQPHPHRPLISACISLVARNMTPALLHLLFGISAETEIIIAM